MGAGRTTNLRAGRIVPAPPCRRAPLVVRIALRIYRCRYVLDAGPLGPRLSFRRPAARRVGWPELPQSGETVGFSAASSRNSTCSTASGRKVSTFVPAGAAGNAAAPPSWLRPEPELGAPEARPAAGGAGIGSGRG